MTLKFSGVNVLIKYKYYQVVVLRKATTKSLSYLQEAYFKYKKCSKVKCGESYILQIINERNLK